MGWSKAFPVILSAGLLSWAMTLMMLIPDVPREWDFGNLEFTPAKSVYSSFDPGQKISDAEKAWLERSSLMERSKSGIFPDNRMIYPLPEGEPMEKTEKEKD